jgi:hypothetical protein
METVNVFAQVQAAGVPALRVPITINTLSSWKTKHEN